mmetsp:Transcript_84196/g.234821  ORF Transcript_84196/g.234821 Transcript_84196/m.234821 type:complete len:223 (+) Transcript_84196:1433-2101(+)
MEPNKAEQKASQTHAGMRTTKGPLHIVRRKVGTMGACGRATPSGLRSFTSQTSSITEASDQQAKIVPKLEKLTCVFARKHASEQPLRHLQNALFCAYVAAGPRTEFDDSMSHAMQLSGACCRSVGTKSVKFASSVSNAISGSRKASSPRHWNPLQLRPMRHNCDCCTTVLQMKALASLRWTDMDAMVGNPIAITVPTASNVVMVKKSCVRSVESSESSAAKA